MLDISIEFTTKPFEDHMFILYHHNNANIFFQSCRYSSERESWASKQLLNALKNGINAASPDECKQFYKLCPYSSKTMMTLLHMFGRK